MKSRSARGEIIDRPDVSESHMIQSLRFMMRVNRYFGGSKAVLDFFNRQDLPEAFSVADLGSGSGDIPYALARWAERQGKRVRIVGFETSPICLAFAKKHHAHPVITYRAVPASDFEAHGPFDFVITSMFFHHLTDQDIVVFLRRLERASRIGFLINDLDRGALAVAGAAAYAGLTLSAGVVHDASVSVMRGFRDDDWARYREESGVRGLRWRKAPWFRWVVTRTKGAFVD